MKIRTSFVLLVIAAMLMIGGVRSSAQSGYDIFQKALAAERADGNLPQAIELYGRIIFAYGGGVLGVMARRVKGQWNENAKNWGAFDVLPELNHNGVVGFPHPDIARDALTVLLLRSDRDNPRHKLRFDVTRELLDRASIPHKTLEFSGASMLSEVLQLTLFTDYVSFYVALLNGVDPSPVKSIDYLKDRLARG